MSDTNGWEKSVQQVLLPDEDSGDKPIMEMPPKRKLTASHVNKKLEDYHGEIKSEQQTLIESILREKHERELRQLEKAKREQERAQFESDERLKKQRRQAEKERVADERAIQNEGNWRDLKQWREKESGRIDDCRSDNDYLLEGMQDVKLVLNMQGKNFSEMSVDQKKVNGEFHRMLQKQSHFQERTDERVDACERSVDEIHQQLRTITFKIEEPPQREVSPVRRMDRDSPILFSPRAIRGQEELLQTAPSWDVRRKSNVGPL
jgi:hypothetical protein